MATSEVVSDIVIPNAKVYSAPLGTSLPADTVAVGGAWPAGWVSAGFLKEPLTITYEFDVLEVMILQSLAPVARRKTKEGLSIKTTLAEFTADFLNIALDGTVTQTAVGSGQPGKEEITFGDKATITERMWGFEGSYVDEDGATFPIRMFVYKGNAKAGGDLVMGKEDYTGVPLEIGALSDMTKAVGARLFKIQKILEPGS